MTTVSKRQKFDSYDGACKFANTVRAEYDEANPVITGGRELGAGAIEYTVTYYPPPEGDATEPPPPTAPAELEFSPGFPITRFEFFAAMAHVSLRQIFGGPGKIPSKRVADMAFDDARAMEILAEAERPIQGPPEMAQPEPEE